MKTLLVVLYLMNFDGGAPVVVEKFRTMAECEASMAGVVGKPDGHRQCMVCIPIMRAE